MNQNNTPSSSGGFPWKELFTFLGVILAAYIGYLGIRSQTEIPIQATQTAEAKLASGTQPLSQLSEVVTLTPELPQAIQETATPSTYVDPVEFLREYYFLVNNGQYQDAWLKHSDEFDNYWEYSNFVSHWTGNFDRVEIVSTEIRSETSSEAEVAVNLICFYDDLTTDNEYLTYILIKDNARSSWLIRELLTLP